MIPIPHHLQPRLPSALHYGAVVVLMRPHVLIYMELHELPCGNVWALWATCCPNKNAKLIWCCSRDGFFLSLLFDLKKQQEKQGISACSQGLANLRCCLFLSNGHCCALVVSMWRLWAGLDPRHASHLVFVVHCCRGAAFPGGAVSGLARIHLDVIHPTDGQCSSTLSIPGHLQLSWCCCGYIWKRWS